MGGIKRTATDKAISDCVRCAADWTCERCGRKFGGPSQGLHASHYRGRSGRSTRWTPDNLDALCYGCHMHLGGHRFEYDEFKLDKIGEERLDALRLMANKPKKVPAHEEKRIRKHYQDEFKRLKALRDQGVVGPLDIKRYEEGQ